MLLSSFCDYSGVLADDEFCNPRQYESHISKHILLGKKIRQIKYQTYSEVKEHKVIDIMPHKYDHEVGNYFNNSPSPIKNKRNSRKGKPRKKQRDHKEKCPLRVIELAYPSKRHCLETWKTRNKTLPIHMIDRLRKIIYDENPRTPVKDAINFFERSKIKRRQRNVKIVNTTNNSNKRSLNLLCCYFSYKIMDKLEKPMHVKLSSDLARVAHIVNEDVSAMLEYQSLSDDNDTQNEIIKKITLWIEGVLEESSHRLLLEDLREIEEDEGPVLDLLDEVFYKALSNDGLKHSAERFEKYDEKQLNADEFEDLINDKNLKCSKAPNPENHGASKIDVKADERELMENIFLIAMDHVSCHTTEVNNKKKVDDECSTLQSTDLKNIELKRLKDYINFILIELIEEACAKYLDKINKSAQHQTVNINANDLDIQINSDDSDVGFEKKNNTTKDSLVIRSALDLVSKSKINLENVVNGGEEVKSLETSDDGNKKVKFNNNDIDNSMELANTMASHLSSENYLPILKTRSVTIYNDKTSKTIYLSNPSPFLLSKADESWPESSSFHNRGSRIKVSKSVVSLGELLEREEEIFPQSVKDSVEILHLLNSNNKVVKEDNVSIPSILNIADNINTKQCFEKDYIAKDEIATRKNIFDETTKLNSGQLDALITDTVEDVRNEEENSNSALTSQDKSLTFTKTLNQKRKSLNVKKLSNINIVQETYNDENEKLVMKLLREEVRVKTSRQTQHSSQLLNKRTQTNKEALNNDQLATSEKGFNISTEEIGYEEWTEGIDNIVGQLETWLYWIRYTTAEVLNLLQKESGGVKCCKLSNKIDFYSKSCIRRGRDLHKRLEILTCKYHNLKVMPYKCNCNNNICILMID